MDHASSASSLLTWIVGDLRPATGNRVTAEKLATIFSSFSASTGERMATQLVNNSDLSSLLEAAEKRADKSTQTLPSLIVAIHALKSALPVVTNPKLSSVPLVILLSGTDINGIEASGSAEEAEGRRQVLRSLFEAAQTRAAVAISPVFADIYRKDFSFCPAPCFYIPSSLVLEETEGDGDAPALREACGLPSDYAGKIALLVAGVRAVKDPGFLVGKFVQQAPEKPQVHLAIVGPPLDSVLLDHLFSQGVEDRRNFKGPCSGRACYLGAVRRTTLLRWLKEREADLLLNSSLSEGQSNAVLEAMALGIPVAARDVTGNRAILCESDGDDAERGFLFSTPEEGWAAIEHICLGCKQSLPCEHVTARVQNAKQFVADCHSYTVEADGWTKIIALALRK